MNRNQVEQQELPIQPVDEPILCSPYEEPSKHWHYDRETGRPNQIRGRRPPGYWIDAYSTPYEQLELSITQQEGWSRLLLVEKLRADVKRWRKTGYRNATKITKQLLRYWQREDREMPLFFCQLEAVETVIYIAEIRRAKHLLSFPPDFKDEDLEQLRDEELIRYGCKMATGSGKTVVMAMLIAWAFCNRGRERADTRFPSAVLAVCPGLIIRDRLKVLRPGEKGNYYDKFDLVPTELQKYLMQGKVKITNWQQLQLKTPNMENGKSYRVINKGEETDEVYTTRILGDLAGHGEIMVLNDEGHHAYRLLDSKASLNNEEKEEQRTATVWIQGLDRIQRTCGIRFAVDLSATPIYLRSSGHPEGKPFEWIVSDFGLGDAIESGITKIPRIPISDSTGRPEPRYFRLWEHITNELGKNSSPAEIYVKAHEALTMLATQWREQFTAIGDSAIPNCMIVVCPETKIAEEFYQRISGEKVSDGEVRYEPSEVFTELENNDKNTRTLRIDSQLLAAEGSNANVLREVVSTIGTKGEPGEQIRCIVAVSMLNEGWDANNVTQILGLRAFQSPLLCEQIVGRGLRRISYDIDKKTGRFPAEYVDIYGIPFSMIPFKGKQQEKVPGPPKPTVRVRALPERQRDHEIRFPNVESYSFELSYDAMTTDVESMRPIKIEADDGVTVGAITLDEGRHVHLGVPIEHTVAAYYDAHPLQTTLFRIVSEILEKLPGDMSRSRLFPQIFWLVENYTRMKIEFLNRDGDPRVLWNPGCRRQVVDMFVNALQPDQKAGEAPLLPIIDPSNPVGSSKNVDFLTTKDCHATRKSHLNFVAVDSGWEGSAADHFERSNLVKSYVRNERLGFIIRYHFEDEDRDYYPDFIVQLTNDLNLIIEIKGEERTKDPVKYEATKRWVDAVNHARKYGRWAFDVCEKLFLLPEILEKHSERN